MFSVLTLFHVIRTCYHAKVFDLIRKSPRFGILLAAIILSLIFTLMDVLASVVKVLIGTDGVNPYWKLALVFKCLTDNIMLDDFKTALRKLGGNTMDFGDNSPRGNEMMLNGNENGDLEKYGSSGNGNGTHVEQLHRTSTAQRASRHSISGRALEDDEVLDNRGRGRRTESLAIRPANGERTKIRPLPKLANFLNFKPKTEAQHNALMNAQIATETQSSVNMGMDKEENVDLPSSSTISSHAERSTLRQQHDDMYDNDDTFDDLQWSDPNMLSEQPTAARRSEKKPVEEADSDSSKKYLKAD